MTIVLTSPQGQPLTVKLRSWWGYLVPADPEAMLKCGIDETTRLAIGAALDRGARSGAEDGWTWTLQRKDAE